VDSTAFDIKVQPKRQQIMVFDVSPADATLRFEIKTEGQVGPDFVGVGSRERRNLDEAFDLTPQMASGFPDEFDADRRSGGIGAYVWWLPGQQMVSAREAARLTPEERRRLKALGYIQ
jgi:hypothetical protein